MRKSFRLIITLLVIVGCAFPSAGRGQVDTVEEPGDRSLASSADAPGDRIVSASKDLEQWIPAALPRDAYCVGPGDTLAIHVRGKAELDYHVRPVVGPEDNPDESIVTPGGEIYLPLAGNVEVAGKTVIEIEDIVHAGLGKYIKHFDVSVAVAKVRTVNVWISGEAENPGPQILPAVSTVSLAALQSGIKPTGSTRRITLIRGDDRHVVDLYGMAVTGNVAADIPLQPGDCVHIPAVTDYVEITGEVVRPGQYEMVSISADSGDFRVRDLVELALGTLPTAALDKAFAERIGEDSKKKAISINLLDPTTASVALERGDKLVIPSISAFQPMIRLIGEFKGDDVYQRVPVGPGESGSQRENVQNKSGIYFLKQGQTVLDVIAATGGVTPQADLKRAYIERLDGEQSGQTRTIPVDLERLLISGDKTADMALLNGDCLVLPALADKVHVFGEVEQPGSFVYGPNRRLIDYLGDAGGPTEMAKLTEVSVVRGTADKPKITKFNAKSAMRGTSMRGNPILEPGDIVFVPSKFIAGWRDALQIVFTSLSLTSLLRR